MKIPALIVKQWLKDWEKINFEGSEHRSRPEDKFYIFSISATRLKRLAGIQRRDRKDAVQPEYETAVQRRHIPERSLEILKYLRSGFPLSKKGTRSSLDNADVKLLQMPGWLPTSVLVNINSPDMISPDDRVYIEEVAGGASLTIPDRVDDPTWRPTVPPISVIDGQHRLWALDEEMKLRFGEDLPDSIADYEIPVVAFRNLAPTWQAYLFYTINQLPKPIDSSLVFDLYPLLRTQDWLLRYEGHSIYRDARAQELVTILWSHPDSPWCGRVLRFGGRAKGKVTQAAMIRSLVASFMRPWDPKGPTKIGGLFGSKKAQNSVHLGWDRDQQAAFIIACWNRLLLAVKHTKADWASSLSALAKELDDAFLDDLLGDISFGTQEAFDQKDSDQRVRKDVADTPAFSGSGTLLATDQGIRGWHSIMNDLLWLAHTDGIIDLTKWRWFPDVDEGVRKNVSNALSNLEARCGDVINLIDEIARAALQLDLRVSSAVSKVYAEQHQRQAAYRGSGGYRLLRENMLKEISQHSSPRLQKLLSDHSIELKVSEVEGDA